MSDGIQPSPAQIGQAGGQVQGGQAAGFETSGQPAQLQSQQLTVIVSGELVKLSDLSCMMIKLKAACRCRCAPQPAHAPAAR